MSSARQTVTSEATKAEIQQEEPAPSGNAASSLSTIMLIQTSIGDYRTTVISEIVRRLGLRFRILLGKKYFYSSLETKIDFPDNMEFVDNVFLLNRRFLLQLFDWRRAIAAGVVILELNPRILSVWVIAIARRLRGRPTLFWGHAWARSGVGSRSDRIRHLMRRLASGIIMYTHSEKASLARRMPDTALFVAPNSLYHRATLGAASADAPRDSFLYVGRIVTDKKVDIAVRGFAELVRKTGFRGSLIIVGKGPDTERCQVLARELGIDAQVDFAGHIGDVEVLRRLYHRSIASLSPGYVGLSLIQSLGFGVPMIISREEPHAPELEAVNERVNALFFETDDPASLASVMAGMIERKAEWAGRGEALVDFCRAHYSTEAMAAGILEAIEYAETLSVPRP
jgi:glycosyltransferase involved in cell wall biosynthesis